MKAVGLDRTTIANHIARFAGARRAAMLLGDLEFIDIDTGGIFHGAVLEEGADTIGCW